MAGLDYMTERQVSCERDMGKDTVKDAVMDEVMALEMLL